MPAHFWHLLFYILRHCAGPETQLMAIKPHFLFLQRISYFTLESQINIQQWYCIRVIVSRWNKKNECLGLKATICHDLDSANDVTDFKYIFVAFNALFFFQSGLSIWYTYSRFFMLKSSTLDIPIFHSTYVFFISHWYIVHS